MTTGPTRKRIEDLADEIHNFQEIAQNLKPSPGEVPRLDGIEIAGFTKPLREVIGGDHIIYIDFNGRYDLAARIAEARDNGSADVAANLARLKTRAGILVADVAGHRMTDALIGAMLHQAFLLGVYYELDMFGEITTRIFEHINTRFYRTTATNKYFTMIYGEITDEGQFRFISAGHQPPAIFSREFGRFMPISPDRLVSVPPVGMLPSCADPDDRANPRLYAHKKRFTVNEIDLLAVGDILLLYTDGLTEYADGSYFPERLERLLSQVRDRPAAEISDCIEEDLLRHGEPCDDVSVVVIRKTA